MMRSLQNRLLLGIVAGTSLVLVVSGAVLYVLIRAELIAVVVESERKPGVGGDVQTG